MNLAHVVIYVFNKEIFNCDEKEILESVPVTSFIKLHASNNLEVLLVMEDTCTCISRFARLPIYIVEPRILKKKIKKLVLQSIKKDICYFFDILRNFRSIA